MVQIHAFQAAAVHQIRVHDIKIRFFISANNKTYVMTVHHKLLCLNHLLQSITMRIQEI